MPPPNRGIGDVATAPNVYPSIVKLQMLGHQPVWTL